MRGILDDPELSAKKTRAPGLRWIDGLEGKAVEDLLDHCLPPPPSPLMCASFTSSYPSNLLERDNDMMVMAMIIQHIIKPALFLPPFA